MGEPFRFGSATRRKKRAKCAVCGRGLEVDTDGKWYHPSPIAREECQTPKPEEGSIVG